MGMVIGCVLSPTFEIFTAFRSLQGLFGTIPQVIGLPIIYDMYHPGDWPRMINIWGYDIPCGSIPGPGHCWLHSLRDWQVGEFIRRSRGLVWREHACYFGGGKGDLL